MTLPILPVLATSVLPSLAVGQAVFMLGISVVASIMMVEGARMMTIGLDEMFPTYNPWARAVLFTVFLVACDGLLLALVQDAASFFLGIAAQIVWILITSLTKGSPALSALFHQTKKWQKALGQKQRHRSTWHDR